MALEHALLVSLSERPASGLDLARRFDKSIGYFWQASHQQIYKTLGRMETDGWLTSTVVEQHGRPDKKVYDVSPAGRLVLQEWLTSPTDPSPLRSELGVKMRAASYAVDREAVLADVRGHLADHQTRLDVYRQLAKRDYADPTALTGQALDQYLVLRGGIRMEEAWVAWLDEYLTAHTLTPRHGSRHGSRHAR
jgi:DNA-binding PadR family transcriptional regulator